VGNHRTVIGSNALRLKTFGGLWIENSATQSDGGPRPRSLALLAMLAAAGSKGVSRDRALGILWPESDPERARHALSQTVYNLRRELRTDVVLSTPDLRLDARLITSDVDEFRLAIAAKDWSTATDLYSGPFLDGFYLADAPEFERWVEEERGALASSGLRAIEATARQRTSEHLRDEALELWRRLTRLDPLSTPFATAYMQALAARGERTAALAHGKAFTELLRQELDAEPDRSIQILITRLRDAEHGSSATMLEPVEPEVRDLVMAAAAPEQTIRPDPIAGGLTTRPSHRLLIAAIVFGVVAATAVSWRVMAARSTSATPVLAVGRLRDLVSPDSTALGGVLSEMLSTSLARLTDIHVVANSRMLELTQRDADTSGIASTDAARRAGATEIIEGELIPVTGGQLRLDVRRVDIRRGFVRRGYQILGTDRLVLFDSITSLIAADLRVRSPTTTLAEVSTRSPIALRLYEEGLRAFYQYDVHAAGRLFRAAIREDSAFAMAAYYAWRTAAAVNDPAVYVMGRRVMSLASRAPERDRLLILAHVGLSYSDRRAIGAADSLAKKYPSDPEALMRAAEVTRDLPRAVALLNRSIALDSAAGAGSGICRMCDALTLLVGRYQWADSSAALARTLERWKRMRPDDPAPWSHGADALIGFGRRAEAETARLRAVALGSPAGDVNERTLLWALRTDDFETVNAQCRQRLADSDGEAFINYRWFCTIGLRMQGRYRDALMLNREGRVPGTDVVRPRAPLDVYHAAILDLETGRAMVAADAFAAMGRGPVDTTRTADTVVARNLTWWTTLTATAAVASGDTIRARALVDSIETYGSHSLSARDPVLHHFVRGLLYSRAGRTAAAVNEFRSALVSPTFGYTRINYELARSLLAMSRPADAIPVLQAPLHGGLDGSNLYLTRTELHELLAQAFDLAGQRDSAAAHYTVVERAWRHADPLLHPRYDAAQQWLRRDGPRPR
jgi:DNA-binding SARP family transcriptional activator/tetratricopeptide (TPR) repeat protein